MSGRILAVEDLGGGNVKVVVDCDCAHCTTKDWESVFCDSCGHTLGGHSTNGPWCEDCQLECHSNTFLPKPTAPTDRR